MTLFELVVVRRARRATYVLGDILLDRRHDFEVNVGASKPLVVSRNGSDSSFHTMAHLAARIRRDDFPCLGSSLLPFFFASDM